MSPVAEIVGVGAFNLYGDLDIALEEHDKTLLTPDTKDAAATLTKILQENPGKTLQITSDLNGSICLEDKPVVCVEVNTNDARVIAPA